MNEYYSLSEGKKIDPTRFNNLQKGQILELHGYSNPKYVVIKRLPLKCSYPVYLTIDLSSNTYTNNDMLGAKHISEKKFGITLFVTDTIMPENEVNELIIIADNNKEAFIKEQDRLKNEREEKIEIGKQLYTKYIPSDAKALIVAEYIIDESNLMEDYFHGRKDKIVVLGYSTNTRDSFSEMRKFCHLYEPVSHYAAKPIKPIDADKYWSAPDERREKYSMGNGYYLKDSYHDNTGWLVRKTSYKMCSEEIYISLANECIFEKIKPSKKIESTPEHTETTKNIAQPYLSKYKNNDVLNIPMGDNLFSFGKAKAKLIVEHFDIIKKFVSS